DGPSKTLDSTLVIGQLDGLTAGRGYNPYLAPFGLTAIRCPPSRLRTFGGTSQEGQTPTVGRPSRFLIPGLVAELKLGSIVGGGDPQMSLSPVLVPVEMRPREDHPSSVRGDLGVRHSYHIEEVVDSHGALRDLLRLRCADGNQTDQQHTKKSSDHP